MANNFDFNRANANTPNQDGWCQRWVEQGFGLNGLYPTAFAAYTACPQKRGGLPPSNGNYYLIYFDGWIGNTRYGDICLYKDGKVWSGAAVKWRSGTDYQTYRNWIGRDPLCWSEYVGGYKVATIPTPSPTPTPGGRVAQTGTFKANYEMKIRWEPGLNGKYSGVNLPKGGTVKYDSYIDVDGIRWISYIGNSGNRCFIARRQLNNSQIWGECY